jgi:hypothetical protein
MRVGWLALTVMARKGCGCSAGPLGRQLADCGKRQRRGCWLTHVESRSLRAHREDLCIYGISVVILTAGRNQGWESWTGGKSPRIYSSANTMSTGFWIAVRFLAIGTGEDER